jgi:hypothetical protein
MIEQDIQRAAADLWRYSIKKKVDIPKFKIEDDLLSKSVEDDEAAAS